MTDKEVLNKIIELSNHPTEMEWFEFKESQHATDEIGEYISALSNAATLKNLNEGYLVWGVRDGDHALVGTSFDPFTATKGNQNLIIWLRTHISPDLDTHFYSITHEGKKFVLLVIPQACDKPTRFQSKVFIRVGSVKKNIVEVPALEKKLWQMLSKTCFEDGLAVTGLSASDVLLNLDYPAYFSLLNKGLPENKAGIIDALEQEEFIQNQKNDAYAITNLGAILLAKNLDDFKGLSRKALRVIVYKEETRAETIKEQVGKKGYAAGFAGAIDFINNLLPMNEIIGSAFRKEIKLFPELAIRELLANALIHQDLSLSGTGPMVEIFSDRIEITNPGIPLIDVKRFMDHSPRSRNEKLAAFMRRAGICEERGSGIDKVFLQVESFQLPPPDFQVMTDSTRIILFGVREHSDMSPNERVWACYWHAVLLYVSGAKKMTNTSLRERLGIAQKNYSMASKVIAGSIKAGLIKNADPESPKSGSYIPFWA